MGSLFIYGLWSFHKGKFSFGLFVLILWLSVSMDAIFEAMVNVDERCDRTTNVIIKLAHRVQELTLLLTNKQ